MLSVGREVPRQNHTQLFNRLAVHPYRRHSMTGENLIDLARESTSGNESIFDETTVLFITDHPGAT